MVKHIDVKDNIIKGLFFLAILCCLFRLVNSPIALLGGFIFNLLLGNPFQALNQKAINWLLKIAVVGLGFGMNVDETLETGSNEFVLTLGTIILVLILGFLFGKLMKLNVRTSHLIASGTAICGGSAIASVAPVIRATTKSISISLGIVFLLNSIALLIFPLIGRFLDMSQYEFGLWCAIAIHDTSSVVGAALNYGDEALKIATTVKLARALWIIPVTIVSIFLFKGKSQSIKFPWYILFFILAILLNSYFSIPSAIPETIVNVSKSLLIVTLFLVGAGLSVQQIKSAGWKPMILGISLWVVISLTSLYIIMNF